MYRPKKNLTVKKIVDDKAEYTDWSKRDIGSRYFRFQV